MNAFTTDHFLEALRETRDAENLVRTEERWRDLKALELAEALADGQIGRANELLEEFKASRRDLEGLRIDAKRWADKLEAIMADQKQEMPPAGATAEGSETNNLKGDFNVNDTGDHKPEQRPGTRSGETAQGPGSGRGPAGEREYGVRPDQAGEPAGVPAERGQDEDPRPPGRD